MDLKSLFKRKAASDAPPPQVPKKTPKTKKVRDFSLSRSARSGLLAAVLLLLVLLGGLFYVANDPDLSKEYADFIPSFIADAPPPPPPPVVTRKAPPAASAVAASNVVSTPLADASAPAATSAVTSGSGVASASSVSASGILPLSAVQASNNSDVAPMFPLAATESGVASAPAPAKPRSNVAAPAQSRDMRHCLNLKTEAEVMRCVYPRR